MQSPSAALRPWPTCSGPVGLAETNSTITFCPLGGRRPKRSWAASTSDTTACLAAAARRKLMKPGPAISKACTQRCTAGCCCNNATRRCASSRGFFFKGRANCIALVTAKSPWLACLGDSKVATGTSAPASPASCASAACSACCNSCFTSIMSRFYFCPPATCDLNADWPPVHGFVVVVLGPPSRPPNLPLHVAAFRRPP